MWRDGYEFAAEIRFLRQTHKGSFLLVEGANDSKTLARFTDGQCLIQPGFGRENVLEALDLLENDGFPGVFALVDSEFDKILGISHPVENICFTDFHDLDLTIIYSGAGEIYLREYCDQQKLRQKFSSSCAALLDHIVESLKPLSLLRLINKKEDLGLKFTDLTFSFVDSVTLAINLDRMIDEVLSQSKRPKWSKGQLATVLNKLLSQNMDKLQNTNGHDVMTVVGLALRNMVGNRQDNQTWRREIEAGVRIAFSIVEFSRTAIKNSISDWQSNNVPYKILS